MARQEPVNMHQKGAVMVYQWNGYKYPVSALTAGKEFEQIEKEEGEVRPEYVVDRARPEESALHKCFEWDDAVAAEKYREDQAGHMIRALVVVHEKAEEEEPLIVRAYQNVSDKDGATRHGSYIHVTRAFQYEESRDIILSRAMREMQAFRNKYAALQEFAVMFSAFDEMKEEA